MVDERRTVTQPYLARDPAPPSLPHGSSEPGRRLVARNLADVQPEPTDWAWQGVIPLGTMTGIAGTAGIGKSTVVSWLTAAFTKGALDGDLKGEPATVLLAAGEDDTARQLKPRLQVAGADLSRVVEFVPEVRDASGSAFETML
ncbi:AAA family ATPase, partial [Escherichia coli]